MNKKGQKTKNAQKMKAPPPALRKLVKLFGTWDLKGRTLDSKEDNITGWTTFEWMLGGYFIKVTGEIEFMGFKVQSLEMIGYDPVKRSFPSHVYSNVPGDVLQYYWDISGNKVMHWMETSRYTGTLSKDGNTLTGGWRPIKGKEGPDNVSYDAVMTRRK
jgi:hypothetical protein